MSKFGNMCQVASYVPETVLENIDTLRGNKSRSSFVGDILTGMFSTEGTEIKNRIE